MGSAWIVIGGGISGLLAAWHLQRRGGDVEVWEASPAPGGFAQTLAWPGPGGEPGFLERGPQGLLVSRDGPMKELLDELALKVLSPGPRGPRWLGKGGGRHPGPASFAGLLRAPGLTLGERLRIFAEPFVPPGAREDDTLQTFFERRAGKGFARELLPALVAGVLAAPPHRIGMDAMPRLKRMEALGGLVRGGLALGPEKTVHLAGGTGALARALASNLRGLRLDHPARALESLPGGGWRVRGDRAHRDAAQVVLALPADGAAGLLAELAPGPTRLLAELDRLDLAVWHSRHPAVPGWERGMGLLVHPPEGRGLMGVVSLAAGDPRGVPGFTQLRTYVGGAFPADPALARWPGVFAELRRWLPELADPVQVRAEHAPRAFNLLGPGHAGRAERILGGLPPGIHWIGAARSGPSLKDLAGAVGTWAAGLDLPA